MISKKEFTEQVEKLLSKKSSIEIDVLGAIIKVCEDNNLEPEGAKRLLSDPLKQKLEAEAKQLNLIDRGKNTKGTITSFFK